MNQRPNPFGRCVARLRGLVLAPVMFFSSHALAAPVPEIFSPAGSGSISEMVVDYQPAHPDVQVALNKRLRELQREQAQGRLLDLSEAAVTHQNVLLHDGETPVVNANGKVSLVVFSDYQCIYCARLSPLLDMLMKQHPKVRVVFREWPIFGARWPASLTAARTGLAVWQQAGPQAYLRYHNALFDTGHNEGALKQADIDGVLKAQGLALKPADSARSQASLKATQSLAITLGLTGTPAIFVMPTRHATVATTTAIPGMPDMALLETALARAAML